MGIDTAQIERELDAMWAGESPPSGDDASQSGVVRARVLNLVVYSHGPSEREHTDALLSEAYERNPGRALVIYANPEAEDDAIEAYASMRCSLSIDGAKQVCGEQVTIEARGESVERAASAVASLLVPDVPVFLWWRDIPHYEDKLFGRLVETADRIVIDSSAFDNAYADFLKLASLVGSNPSRTAFSDLNWGRLTAWRSLVASFWDVEEYRLRLENIEEATIAYTVGPEARYEESSAVESDVSAETHLFSSGLLLLGWLASRLVWRVDSERTELYKGGARVAFTDSLGREISTELRPAFSKDVQKASLSSVSFKASDGDCEFRVEHLPERDMLRTVARVESCRRIVERVIEVERRSEGEMLSDELNILARDRVYEHAILAFAEIIEALQSRLNASNRKP